LKIKEFISKRLVRGRKPWHVASDVVFFLLIILFLIPGTRSVLLSGVAAVRTFVTGSGAKPGQGVPLDQQGWSWNLSDQSKTVPFSSLKGEVIFLNQWATWCPPCRAEMPSIEKLYQKYGDRVRFVMLTNEDPQTVSAFMQRHGYTFPVSYGAVAGSALSSRSIPATAILSRGGEIIVNKKGAVNWNARKIRKLLDRLLAETTPQ
jgi:thiol-disulfide isomerase/thioredoxin